MNNISVKLGREEIKKIKHIVADEHYLNVSDFCRNAIRKEIEKFEKKE